MSVPPRTFPATNCWSGVRSMWSSGGSMSENGDRDMWMAGGTGGWRRAEYCIFPSLGGSSTLTFSNGCVWTG